MYCYRLAGCDFCLPVPFGVLEYFRGEKECQADLSIPVTTEPASLNKVNGWVGGRQRDVEIEAFSSGVLLRLSQKQECQIIFTDEQVVMINIVVDTDFSPVSETEYTGLLDLSLVVALSMQGTWSLHGSAVAFGDRVFVFLGESGFGKSTLAGYLSKQANWQLLADDILPVTLETSGLVGWPHFPQLKLPADAQPGLNWPEQVPISAIYLLNPVNANDQPKVRSFAGLKATQSILSHTAGTRLFDETLLEKHLAFCAQAVEHVSVYQLSYPHSKDALPQVKDLLEGLC